jgi:hypothetical protein
MKRRGQNAAAEENAENEQRQQHPATKQQGQQNLNQRRAQMGEEEEQTEQPPRKITTNKVGGQKREYHFLKAVKSMQELDKFRSKVGQNYNEIIFCNVIFLLELLPIWQQQTVEYKKINYYSMFTEKSERNMCI